MIENNDDNIKYFKKNIEDLLYLLGERNGSET